MQLNPSKLLIVSCYFPPVGGIQVQRALSLARYLPENGFDVSVLTVKNPAVPTFDHGLLDRVPRKVRIHRTLTFEPPFALRKKLWTRIAKKQGSAPDVEPQGFLHFTKKAIAARISKLLCPDPQVLWYPTAVRRAKKLIAREGIGTILVTAPPFSAFLIGNELKRCYPQARLVIDIRDEWLQYFVKKFAFRGNSYVQERAKEIERQSVQLADLVVAVTSAAHNVIRARYPEQPDTKFQVVRNGFDPEAFASFRSRSSGSGKIVVTYVGTIYEPASPASYLDCLDRLPENIRSRFETRFIGRMAEEFDRSIFEGRKSKIQVLPFVPQEAAIRFMEETNLLLLPWTDRLNVPGKALEYLATRKPILAFVPEGGEIDEIVRRTRSGWCVDPSQSGDADRLLTRIATDPSFISTSPFDEEVERYSRTRLAAEYAQLIRGCLVRNSVPNSCEKDVAIA